MTILEVSALVSCITKFINTKIVLTPDEITFMSNLMNDNPDVFSNVATKINDFLKNKQFSVLDIPQIISIIAMVYKNNLSVNGSTIDIFDVVEITILGLLYGNVFQLPDAVNTELENMVKSSILLLKTNITQEKQCFLSFLQWITSCCKKLSR